MHGVRPKQVVSRGPWVGDKLDQAPASDILRLLQFSDYMAAVDYQGRVSHLHLVALPGTFCLLNSQSVGYKSPHAGSPKMTDRFLGKFVVRNSSFGPAQTNLNSYRFLRFGYRHSMGPPSNLHVWRCRISMIESEIRPDTICYILLLVERSLLKCRKLRCPNTPPHKIVYLPFMHWRYKDQLPYIRGFVAIVVKQTQSPIE